MSVREALRQIGATVVECDILVRENVKDREAFIHYMTMVERSRQQCDEEAQAAVAKFRDLVSKRRLDFQRDYLTPEQYRLRCERERSAFNNEQIRAFAHHLSRVRNLAGAALVIVVRADVGEGGDQDARLTKTVKQMVEEVRK